MIASITRQYRRFLFGSLLLLLIVALAVGLGFTQWPTATPAPVFMALSWTIVIILVIGTPIVLLTMLRPGLLPLVELWGLTLVATAFLDPLYSVVATAVHLPVWTYCLYLVALFICVERALYGPWLGGLMVQDMKRQTAVFTCQKSPEELWQALVPDTAHQGAFYWPDAVMTRPAQDSDADCILNLPRRGGYKDALLEIRVETSRAPRRIRYRADPLRSSGDPSQIVDIRIDPVSEKSCQVTYSQQYLSVPFGKRLFHFLNNDFRDTLASVRARLSGRRDRSIQGMQMLQD